MALVEEDVVVVEAEELSFVATTCTAGLMVLVLILEAVVATKPMVIRMPLPLRTRWVVVLLVAHLAMLLRLLDGSPLRPDGEEPKTQI